MARRIQAHHEPPLPEPHGRDIPADRGLDQDARMPAQGPR